MSRLLFALLLFGCSEAYETTKADLSELPEGARDTLQGCSWRAVDAGFAPRDHEACWHIFSGPTQRVASGELSNVCEAPELPTCLALHGSDRAVGYFNRNDRASFEITRYARVATLADGTCEPCE